MVDRINLGNDAELKNDLSDVFEFFSLRFGSKNFSFLNKIF